MKHVFCILAHAILLLASVGCMSSQSGEKQDAKVVRLLDGKNLDQFYSYLTNFGTNSDPDKVFSYNNGVLRISGQHYGYLATRKDFSNYKLVAEFKWGDETWAPRKLNARDSGILVHGTGKDVVWPKSLECQIIEGGTGDILVVGGAFLTIDGVRKGPRIERFDRPGRAPWKDEVGYRGQDEFEKPHGKWNTIEILCEGDKFGVTVNGRKVLEGTNASPTSGKILVQSEGAEIFFRRLDVHPL